MPVDSAAADAVSRPLRRDRLRSSRRPVSVVAILMAVLLAVGAQTTAAAAESGDPESPAPPPASMAEVRGELRGAVDAAAAGERVPDGTGPEVAGLWDDRSQIEPGCAAESGGTRHTICTWGDPDADRTVVLLGSSHMTMWLDGLREPAADNGTKIVGLLKFGCSPIIARVHASGRPYPSCRKWRIWALRKIDGINPDQVVVATHPYIQLAKRDGTLVKTDGKRFDRMYAAGMRRLLTRLRGASNDVVLFGPVALRPSAKSPGRCLEREDMLLAPCENQVSRRHKTITRRDRRAAKQTGARFYNPNRVICWEGRCPVAAGGIYPYRDFSHISRTWSLHVGDALARGFRMFG